MDDPAPPQPGAPGDACGSITIWLGALADGDPRALQPLWDRYFDRLVTMVRGRLCAMLGPAAVNDDEDVAQSVLHALHDGVRAGRFPRLDDRDDLWRVLLHIARCKLIDRHRRAHALRDPRRMTRHEADLASPLDGLVSPGPTPDEAAEMAERFHRRLDSLARPDLKRIAEMKPTGHANHEIADALGCSLRAVTLKLEFIRKSWQTDGAPP